MRKTYPVHESKHRDETRFLESVRNEPAPVWQEAKAQRFLTSAGHPAIIQRNAPEIRGDAADVRESSLRRHPRSV
jgi:hypothetical protein